MEEREEENFYFFHLDEHNRCSVVHKPSSTKNWDYKNVTLERQKIKRIGEKEIDNNNTYLEIIASLC